MLRPPCRWHSFFAHSFPVPRKTFSSPLSSLHVKLKPPPTLVQQAAAANRDFTGTHDTHIAWREVPPLRPGTLLPLYQHLSKAKLSFLIVLTTMAGYVIAPAPAAAAHSTTTLLSTALGTWLCCASTNALNEMVEHPYDAQMPRTRSRPLVRRYISPLHALGFSAATGTLGVALLYTQANAPTALLGLANILLYAFVYTPAKRSTIANTWIGAVVGAIPPLMGWTASTHSLAHPAAWALFALMFAWQFPHFNALAYTLRQQYARAGYRMMAALNPRLNARTSLRYALALFPVCLVFPYLGITQPSFFLLSSLPNALLAAAAWSFSSAAPSARERSARILFFASLIHLPVVLVLLMATKTNPDTDPDPDPDAEHPSHS